MQTDRKWPRFAAPLLLVTAAMVPQSCLQAADRTTLLIPLEHDARTGELPGGVYADEAFGNAAGDGWKAYLRLWKSHHRDPSNPAIRRFLGLPLKGSFAASARRGRSAPRSLRWVGAGSVAGPGSRVDRHRRRRGRGAG